MGLSSRQRLGSGGALRSAGLMLSPSDDQLTTELTIPSQKYDGCVSPSE